MEAHLTEHVGPEPVEWMESHTGVTVAGMAQDVAAGDTGGIYGHRHC